MINRLLYVATATALACVFMFDQNFASNPMLALGEVPDLPLDSWELWGAGIVGVLAGAAFYRERRR